MNEDLGPFAYDSGAAAPDPFDPAGYRCEPNGTFVVAGARYGVAMDLLAPAELPLVWRELEGGRRLEIGRTASGQNTRNLIYADVVARWRRWEREKVVPLLEAAEGDEVFVLGAWQFNVTRAKALIAQRPRTLATVDVPRVARAAGLVTTPQGPAAGDRPIAPIAVDWNYAVTTDLAEPVIVCILQDRDGGCFPLLVDGWHRIAHAAEEGRGKLPAYPLTWEETLSVSNLRGPVTGTKDR